MRNLAQEARALVADPKVTPPWLLYFLRLANAANGNYAWAWKMLPDQLPKTMRRPTLLECAAVLAIHGLA